MEYFYLYAKYEGLKTFKAFSLRDGRPAGNLIYASIMSNTQKEQEYLQEMANDYKDLNLIFQIRDSENGRVVFQTV